MSGSPCLCLEITQPGIIFGCLEFYNGFVIFKTNSNHLKFWLSTVWWYANRNSIYLVS